MTRLPKRIFSAHWTSPTTGMISLTRDWVQKRPPPLFWGHPGQPLQHLRKAPPLVFGDVSGYFTQGNWLTFCLRASRYPNFDLHGKGVYVAGEFNDWAPDYTKRAWRLEPALIGGETYFLLNVQRMRVYSRSKVAFKFVTGKNEWLEVPTAAPNVVMDKSGNHNLCIHPRRTGHHQFFFTPPHAISHSGQSAVLWVEEGIEEEALMMPGEYLQRIDSRVEQGSFIKDGKTHFRLFAPRASGVMVSVFTVPDQGDRELHEASRIDPGTWEAVVPRDLHGAFYFFYVRGEASDAHSAFDPNAAVLDPYALAVAGPEGPAIVLDKARVQRPEKRFIPPWWHDLVIAEAHVRDLVALAPVEMTPAERLGFTGLAKWVRHPDFYLKRLGVNCVELQPIQQNDAKTPEEYHWGYMTNNYFSPNSHYALDPARASQIDEFRDLVAAFHEQGMAVILDVVYNHVGEPNPLQPIDKSYYFELSPDGHYMNWSGCGNTLDCNAPMVRRLIVKSLAWLIEAYDVDGFRFDLAELIGVEALKVIEREIKKVKPSVILVAEPWSFRGHIGYELRHTGFASWNDGYREYLRKYLMGQEGAEGLKYFIMGSLGHMATFPSQSVNYVESHDDMCWMDRITENSGSNGTHPTPLDRRRTHLMAATLFMSIGVPLISCGQDFLRSKRGNNNTYQRGDLNALDYRRMHYYSGTHDYFRRWIALRQGPLGRALCLHSSPGEGYAQFYHAKDSPALGVLLNATHEIPGPRLFYAINPKGTAATIDLGELDLTRYRQVADTERLEPTGLQGSVLRASGASLELPPHSCALWAEK